MLIRNHTNTDHMSTTPASAEREGPSNRILCFIRGVITHCYHYSF